MRGSLKKLVQQTAKRFNIGITTSSHLDELENTRNAYGSLERVLGFGGQHVVQLLEPLRASKAQLQQDVFVLSELGLKHGGYFVEFGATDGVFLSNTHLLEKRFDWTGILAEPARYWHRALRNNRSCPIETQCVWKESNATLTFHEVAGGQDLSTIDSHSSSDFQGKMREKGKNYEVRTISLEDLLAKYSAPRIIDYLSVDTEGSELEILSSFNFDRYQFRVITCEHNYAPQREHIFTLLTSKGYLRKLEQYSLFEDWYVKADLL